MANSILDNPEVRKITIPLSLEAYHDLGKKGYIQEGSELLEGVLIEKMPEDPIHSSIVSRIYKYLLKNLPENLTVRQENLISFKDSEPEPDLAIVDSEKTDYSESHPNYSHLIIEVAKSTINLDREKARIYSNANIPEYWIINLNNLEI
ncbi:MAG: Uma2 family endonuclease, partial [Leptospiraceae bacterium]|nr:Uma2 family endonuclease [Leptospiraceae bacterium]